jgi:hypothetical protein
VSEVQFSPDEIRRLAAEVAEPLRTAVAAGRGEASAAVGIGLPRFLSDSQDSINDLLARVPEALTVLSGMADAFQAQMYDTANAYEMTEQTARNASGAIQELLS